MKQKQTARPIMIQGTCSNAGKSLIAAGLCRIFSRDGYCTAPFKSQNMALNSYVTADNREMGRAQVTQAYACYKEPDARMNPVLLKPSSETGSQVIVDGIAGDTLDFTGYRKQKEHLKQVIREDYRSLAAENDIVVIEGAGSPAEINLAADEIVNMYVARETDAPVIIVGDIDRGGVYAHFYGTCELLADDDKKRIAGFLVNKFRGDASLLVSAHQFLSEKTGVPVLGVVPVVPDLCIPEEDSVSFKSRIGEKRYDGSAPVSIALIDLPHISNFTDYDAFLLEPDVHLYTVATPGELGNADLILIPGSKNVIADLHSLRTKGFEDTLHKCARAGVMIAGICGGYQMLGTTISDPGHLESSSESADGLEMLQMRTVLEAGKVLSQTDARTADGRYRVKGYEIHHGHTETNEKPYLIRGDETVVGVRRHNVWGTYLHGIFDNAPFRRAVLNEIRQKKNLPPLPVTRGRTLDAELDRLADHIEASVDMNRIYRCMGIVNS